MVSDYFVCKNKDDNKAIEIVSQRIVELKAYIRNNLMTLPADNKHWHTASIYTAGIYGIGCHANDHFYVSSYLFDKMKSEWTANNKIKLDDQDWRYLIYMVVKDLGYVVSYANGTLGIHSDVPPLITAGNFTRKVKPKWLKEKK